MTCLAVWAPMRSAISSGIQRHAVVRAADRAVIAIDMDDDVLFFAVVFLGGRDQGRFDAFEDDLLVDVLVAVDRVDDPKQFVGDPW